MSINQSVDCIPNNDGLWPIFPDCEDIFRETVDYHMTGAEALVGLDTLQACAEGCVATPNCFAFDYDRSANPWDNKRCWAHTDMESYV